MAEVKNYAVRFQGGPGGSGMGVRAQIHLFGESNKMEGAIDFFDEGVRLKKKKKKGHIYMALHISQLLAVVDILRNEKPIFIEWQEKGQNAYLGTSQEPVGEGE